MKRIYLSCTALAATASLVCAETYAQRTAGAPSDYPMRLVRIRPLPPLEILDVRLVVPLVPHHLAVPLEREDVRRDAVQEPAVVRDDEHRAGEFQQRFLQRADDRIGWVRRNSSTAVTRPVTIPAAGFNLGATLTRPKTPAAVPTL